MSYITDYHYQWTLAVALGSAWVLVAFAYPRFGLFPTALFAYLVGSTLWVWSLRDNRYVTVNPYDQTALRYFSADSLLKGLLVLVPLMMLSDKRERFFEHGKKGCLWFVLLNSACIIMQFVSSGCSASNSCGGFVGNPSLSAGLMACMLPLVVMAKRDVPTLMLAALAIFISKSSIAVGLLAICLLIWGVIWLKRE